MSRYRTSRENRLRKVSFSGQGVSHTFTGQVKAGARISLESNQVNQLSLELVDDLAMSLWRKGNIRKGTTVVYDGWLRFEVRGYSIDPNSGSVAVTVRSKGTSKLKDQRGAKNWGKQNVSKWMEARFREAGLKPIVQPGLGTRPVARQKAESGSQADSTWDVMSKLRDELGCWLFEAGEYGVFARPSWLYEKTPLDRWSLRWNSATSYSGILAGSPKYSYNADSSPTQELSFQLVSYDAGDMKPGDKVYLTGSYFGANGGWIVKSVTIPLSSTAPVEVTCMRPRNPVPQKAG